MPLKARRAGRRLAIDVLYEAEIRGTTPGQVAALRRREGWVTPEPPDAVVLDYALALVRGVEAHQEEIDAFIARYADRWALERMPVVDRNLARMALWELLWGRDVPVAVAINEAVELAKAFSTEDSGRFLNGLLGRIVEAESRSEQ